jgi:hypothetical protein
VFRNGGLSVALTGFFDETGTHAGHPITGVGGFLFDDRALAAFEAAWKKRTAELAKPFHTADCASGYDQFEGWPERLRLLLMHDVAEIIAHTKIAGFVAFIEKANWDNWARINQPEIVRGVGSPYSACLLHCIAMVKDFVDKQHPQEEVFYLFEAGCDRQLEAAQFLFDLERIPKTKEKMKLSGHGFASRQKASALCAADFISWQWQRNYVEAIEDQKAGRTGYWRSEFQVILDSENIYLKSLVDGSLSVRALINAFNRYNVLTT